MKARRSVFVATVMTAAALAGCEKHYIDDTFTFDEAITQLDVNADANVRVEASDEDTGYVRMDVYYRGSEADYDVFVSGNTLKVVYKCRFDCGGTIVVRVPPSVISDIYVDSGNIDVKDLEGNATITSDSGNIKLNGLFGRLDLDADSGNISGTVSSKKCVAYADSGNISLKFKEIPHSLDLAADSGNITVRVPRGSYNISSHVDSGSRNIDNVTLDSSASNSIQAEVDSGNLSIIGY